MERYPVLLEGSDDGVALKADGSVWGLGVRITRRGAGFGGLCIPDNIRGFFTPSLPLKSLKHQ